MRQRLSVGEFHSAFVTGAGELLSWGSGVDGQLGVEPKPDEQKDVRRLTRPRPARAAVGLRVVAVSAGADHTVGAPGARCRCCCPRPATEPP